MLTFATSRLSGANGQTEDAASFFCLRSFDRAVTVMTLDQSRHGRAMSARPGVQVFHNLPVPVNLKHCQAAAAGDGPAVYQHHDDAARQGTGSRDPARPGPASLRDSESELFFGIFRDDWAHERP